MTAKQWRESNPGLKGNIRDNAAPSIMHYELQIPTPNS